jgi:hypothetical protein
VVGQAQAKILLRIWCLLGEVSVTDDELLTLADHVARLQASPPSDERDAEMDIVEGELAMLSASEQAVVLRRLGR